ncbi:MAG: LPS export ABC transporter permease LptG [Pseudohongiellaceae bacterium]
MARLDRYIRNTVLLAIALVMLALAGLDFIFTLFEEAGGTNEVYTIPDALKYVLLTMPRHLYELLPITALVGALIGLGILASNNELVVMQCSGVKTGRIIWAVMKPAIVLMLLGLMLGEFIAPPLELRAEVNKAVASGESVALSRFGHWQKDNEQFMHFNAIDPDGILYGVTVYRYAPDGSLLSNLVAERATYQHQSEQPYWLLGEVVESVFLRQDGQLQSTNTEYATRPWDVGLTPELLQVLIIDPDKMAISDLFRFASRFRSQGLDADEYFLAFWKKILQPLSTAVLVLVAISFIFGPLRQSSMGSRLFVAIGFGLLFIILQNLFGTVSLVYGLDPLLAVLLPITLSILVGLALLRKAV